VYGPVRACFSLSCDASFICWPSRLFSCRLCARQRVVCVCVCVSIALFMGLFSVALGDGFRFLFCLAFSSHHFNLYVNGLERRVLSSLNLPNKWAISMSLVDESMRRRACERKEERRRARGKGSWRICPFLEGTDQGETSPVCLCLPYDGRLKAVAVTQKGSFPFLLHTSPCEPASCSFR
jgi:hypothetical protein